MTMTDTSSWQQGWGPFQYQGDINNPSGFRWTTSDGLDPRLPKPTTPTSTTPPAGTSQADSSAKAIIDGALGQYGLASLSSWAWQKWQSGETIDQIMLELRSTPEYKTRFPAMDFLSKQGRAISEAQYINYEQSAASIFKAAGLPPGFYDGPEDFSKFLMNDVALPELQSRVQAYQTAAFSSPPEVLNELKSLYGVSPGELTAFFIDPDKALPLVQKRFAAAQAAGWSDKSGFGALNQSQAEMVGDLGLSQAQLAQQFGDLSKFNEVYTPLIGSGETQIGKDVVLGGTFGANGQDQAIIDARKRARLAAFSGGGQVATSQQGAVGAGEAR